MVGLATGCIAAIILAISVTIVCIKKKLQRKMKKTKKPGKRRSRSAARRAAARNDTEAQFYEETTFASGTRTQLSANYTSMVRDPYGYADLWLEGDVHIHIPADLNDSYEEVQGPVNTQMVFSEYIEPHQRDQRQRKSTKDPYYLTILPEITDGPSERRCNATNQMDNSDLLRSRNKGHHLKRCASMPL